MHQGGQSCDGVLSRLLQEDQGANTENFTKPPRNYYSVPSYHCLTFLTFEIKTSQDLNITLSKCFKYPTCFQQEIFKKNCSTFLHDKHFSIFNTCPFVRLYVHPSDIPYRLSLFIIKMCLFKCSIIKGICHFWEFSFYRQKKVADYENHLLFAEKIIFILNFSFFMS